MALWWGSILAGSLTFWSRVGGFFPLFSWLLPVCASFVLVVCLSCASFVYGFQPHVCISVLCLSRGCVCIDELFSCVVRPYHLLALCLDVQFAQLFICSEELWICGQARAVFISVSMYVSCIDSSLHVCASLQLSLLAGPPKTAHPDRHQASHRALLLAPHPSHRRDCPLSHVSA